MPNTPKVIDLYSGVGGLSLGAVKAGFNLVAAVEQEQRITDSHKLNFPTTLHICDDVSSLSGKALSSLTKLKTSDLAGLIGGPPCQGFSTIGKRNVFDERNNLFSIFYKLASELKPAFFLAENVPGILSPQYNKLRNGAFKLVKNDYQILKPISISANEFGTPTIRTRIFFIGIRKDIPGAENLITAIDSMKAKNSVFVIDALHGLPIKISDKWITYQSSWRRFESDITSPYLETINTLVNGLGSTGAIKRFQKNQEISGCFGTRHSEEVAKRYAALQPGQQDKVSKSHKLKAHGFCPTLRAGTDNTRGSFQAVRPIHYSEHRVITPREAARLQGFPDWFQFHETKWHSFRQIGNSVCPIVAEKVFTAIKKTLNL